jgi:serine/threonine protein kinase/WD40 repeat protein
MLHYPCPRSEHLQRLVLGQCEEAELCLFEEHLQQCDECFAAMQRLKMDDPLVQAMETAVTAGAGLPADAELRPLLDRLIRLPETMTGERGTEVGERSGVGGKETPTTLIATGIVERGEPAYPKLTTPPIHEYEILGELGKGGSSIVFRARHLKLNRLVALKMLLGGSYARPDERERFRLEAEAVARLQHPHVVQIFEVGEHQGMPFCALELVEGGNLADRLNGAPLPAAAGARLTIMLAQAMHAAHQAGIIHRDLKPANVLLATSDRPEAVWLGDPAGKRYEPKIADFGLARRLDGGTGFSLSGDVMGTPSYMAPEQAAGRVREIGPASDVWALGAILYEMLTGRAPFRGVTVLDTLEQVRLAEPVSPRRLQPTVPRDLETICLKCLRKEQGRRYASAAELSLDLQRHLNGEPVQARAVGAVERGVKWTRRNPGRSVAVAAVVVLAAGLTSGLVVHTARLDRERRAAEQSAAEAREERNYSELRLAYKLLQSGDLSGLGELLDRTENQRDPRGNSFAWRYLERQRRDTRREFRAHDGAIAVLALTPDGQRLVSASSYGAKPAAIVWDSSTGVECFSVPVFTSAPDAAVAALSGDGRTLAVCCERDTVAVHDVGTREEKARLRFADLQAIALSPDCRTLASGTENGRVKFWDVTTKGPWRAPVAQLSLGSPVRAVSYAPDGRHFLTSDDDKGVQVWNCEAGKVASAQSASLLRACTVHYLMWSSDGRSLLGVEASGAVYCWDFLKRALFWSCRTWPPVTAAAWSADGKRLALGRPGDLVEQWDLLNWELRRPPGQRFAGPMRSVIFTPVGRGLITACELRPQQINTFGLSIPGVPFPTLSKHVLRLRERTTDAIRAWDVTTGKERHTAPLPERSTFAPPSLAVLSPDGLVLACAGEDGRIDLLDQPSGRSKTQVFVTKRAQDYAPVAELAPAGLVSPRYPDGVRSLSFSPSGRWLAALSTHGRVRIWETTSWQEHWMMPNPGIEVVWAAFAPDDQLVTSQGSELRWWDVAGRKLHRTLSEKGTTSMSYRAFDSSGRWLATGMADGRIQLWDLETGKRLPLLLGHHERVTALAFAPDGTLASGSWDQTVHLWDRAGRDVGTLVGPRGRIWSLAFSPDGTKLAAGGEGPGGSGDVVVWRTDR